MCQCTPEIRTPFCGKPGCVPPGQPEGPVVQPGDKPWHDTTPPAAQQVKAEGSPVHTFAVPAGLLQKTGEAAFVALSPFLANLTGQQRPEDADRIRELERYVEALKEIVRIGQNDVERMMVLLSRRDKVAPTAWEMERAALVDSIEKSKSAPEYDTPRDVAIRAFLLLWEVQRAGFAGCTVRIAEFLRSRKWISTDGHTWISPRSKGGFSLLLGFHDELAVVAREVAPLG